MKSIIFLAVLIAPNWIFSQQIADTTYHPEIKNPVYEPGKGPVVFIDEGHHNFHTKNGRFKAFSNVLKRDGYLVKEYQGEFNKKELEKGKILVISNALNEINVENWYLPNPSAFTKNEIEVIRQWVLEGGSLFLIADHMPLAGAAKDLAAAFNFEFTNGFAMDTLSGGPAIFTLKEKTLTGSILTQGRDSTESVSQIATFTGQAFKIPADATPVLTFTKKHVNFLPDTAWVFNAKTVKHNVEGWSQGAYKNHGKGKIVAFGEAAMFTAQLAGPQKRMMGMNNEVAPENYKLLLNIIHWLDGKLK
ncbi:MAG: hypothetical protein AB9842_06960 [Bacteroidales bacterium]